MTKEPHSGKLVDEWNKLVSDAEKKPTVVDAASAVASFLAVKDEEELVRSYTYPYAPPPLTLG